MSQTPQTVAEKEAKIAELEAEIRVLQQPDFVEYPKQIPVGDGYVEVASAAAEKAVRKGGADPVPHAPTADEKDARHAQAVAKKQTIDDDKILNPDRAKTDKSFLPKGKGK